MEKLSVIVFRQFAQTHKASDGVDSSYGPLEAKAWLEQIARKQKELEDF